MTRKTETVWIIQEQVGRRAWFDLKTFSAADRTEAESHCRNMNARQLTIPA